MVMLVITRGYIYVYLICIVRSHIHGLHKPRRTRSTCRGQVEATQRSRHRLPCDGTVQPPTGSHLSRHFPASGTRKRMWATNWSRGCFFPHNWPDLIRLASRSSQPLWSRLQSLNTLGEKHFNISSSVAKSSKFIGCVETGCLARFKFASSFRHTHATFASAGQAKGDPPSFSDLARPAVSWTLQPELTRWLWSYIIFK